MSENFLNLIKETIMGKPTHTLLNGKDLMLLSQHQEQEEEVHSGHFYSNLGVLARSVKQEKEI